ncbi:12086_t:CDS:1, partial [Acaulospora morrowiae]
GFHALNPNVCKILLHIRFAKDEQLGLIGSPTRNVKWVDTG